MQKEHKDYLQRNFVKLDRETPVDVIIDHLYQSGILTDELKEDILQQTNSYSRTRQLISIIQRRGSEAFDCFCTALAMEGKSNMIEYIQQLDVRQRWKIPDSSQIVPTKKGISLTYDKWEALKGTFTEVRQVVPEFEDIVPCILGEDHQLQMKIRRKHRSSPSSGFHEDN
ncbi:uncharacterized protein LOC127712016 [Mytilus californianus]|uniref:uncharacterized protein LOC127712016 n=1 Tax=Mytilus californianus TaxID=6549 RepID=UPI00224707A5|nr:uncharacterized protein LOC127712016 [Mytilus californianus]